MSDFSSLELDRPLEQSSVIDTLRQPIWIALITSVGIHAALGINLSKLPWFSDQPKFPPTVGLIELTPEQLERLPQPETPEITFSTASTIPETPNLSPVAPPPTGELPSLPESSSSELPEIPVDPSDYKLPELPPEDSISFSSSSPPSAPSAPPSNSTPSVSRLPQNQSTVDNYSYNNPSTYPSVYPSTYPSVPGRSPLPITPVNPVNPAPVPNISPQPVDIFQAEPPQEPNQEQIDEFELRKNLNLTDKVYESGLSRRQTIEIDPSEETATVENSTQPRSYSENLRLPPRRYQDKEQNQIAITPNDSYTQIEETPVATATPETPPQPDPTKKNRLSEAPIVRRLREGKTIQEIAEEAKQQENVAVATPPEVEPQETPSPAPTPEQQTKIKGSLLKKFENSQQQQVAETTPSPKPSPESSPPVQQQVEFRGSLLQKLKEQKQQNAAVTEESESREIALGAVGAYTEWAIELGLEEASLTKSQAISDVYPEAACERKLEAKASVGVLVGPDGAIESGPKLLLESGYAVLDEAALDAVSQRSFSASDRSKLYQYEFSFDSSNCSAAQPTEEQNTPVGETLPIQEQQTQETAQPTEDAIPIEVMPAQGE